MKLHHIGIACKDIQKQIQAIEKFHKIIKRSDIIYDEQQEASLCLMQIESGEYIEFIAGKQVEKLVKKGIGYYHICYEVEDIHAKIVEFENNGAVLVSPPKPAKLFDMRKIAFLYLPYGLVELIEKSIAE